MEVDLDKIERVAKAAENEPWDFGLGRAEVCGEERSALWWNAEANGGLVVHHVGTANPPVVLELVRRLREAEARVAAHIDEAVEAEREACAKVCEQQIRRAGDGMTFYTAVGQCAAAIRTRSIQPAKGGD